MNITFQREAQEKVSKKNRVQVVRSTVGLCKDCGYTWKPSDESVPAKRKTWLWVLGWICIFPLPLTLILLKKKTMAPVLKITLILIAWIVYLAIWISGSDQEEMAQQALPPDENAQTAAAAMAQPQEAEGIFALI